MVKTETTINRAAFGRPGSPTNNTIVTVPPGENYMQKSWCWPVKSLVWTNKERTKGYEVKKEGPLKMVFCKEFRDDQGAFASYGIKSPIFNVGKVCTKPVKLDFKILQSE
jgi:hypothetical protein